MRSLVDFDSRPKSWPTWTRRFAVSMVLTWHSPAETMASSEILPSALWKSATAKTVRHLIFPHSSFQTGILRLHNFLSRSHQLKIIRVGQMPNVNWLVVSFRFICEPLWPSFIALSSNCKKLTDSVQCDTSPKRLASILFSATGVCAFKV